MNFNKLTVTLVTLMLFSATVFAADAHHDITPLLQNRHRLKTAKGRTRRPKMRHRSLQTNLIKRP